MVTWLMMPSVHICPPVYMLGYTLPAQPILGLRIDGIFMAINFEELE